MAEEIARRIVIASFTTPQGAEQTLTLLKGANVSLGNTAVVTRNELGEVNFTESQDWGIGKSALVGAIAGLLLPGGLLCCLRQLGVSNLLAGFSQRCLGLGDITACTITGTELALAEIEHL